MDHPVDDPTGEDLSTFTLTHPDAYEFFLNLGPLRNANERHFRGTIGMWNDLMKHGTYDSYWQARNLRPHFHDIRAAMLTVGGWFDAEDLSGPFAAYREIERNNPEIPNILVIVPWAHGAWHSGNGEVLGNVRFSAKTAEFFRNEIELPFFRHHLKGEPISAFPKAIIFETGTNRWRRCDSWPPKDAKPQALYFHANGFLAFTPPVDDIGAFDEYISDPNKPVPFVSYIASAMTPEHMNDDQRFAATRPDVLVYQTDVLSKDVTIVGPMTASLHVSSSATDSDWIIKLVDVYPRDYPNREPRIPGVEMGGYQQLVRAAPMRGKFRNSFAHPEPLIPGERTKIEWELPDVYHSFRTGHRIMIQVQSSWFPLIDRNPQTFCDIYNAREEDFQKATQCIHRSSDAPSGVKVNTIET